MYGARQADGFGLSQFLIDAHAAGSSGHDADLERFTAGVEFAGARGQRARHRFGGAGRTESAERHRGAMGNERNRFFRTQLGKGTIISHIFLLTPHEVPDFSSREHEHGGNVC